MQEDYPSAMAQMRRALIPHFKRAKELKQEARLVRYKLLIERKECKTKTAHLIANKLKMKDVAEKKTADHHIFPGRYSPFSNFHPSVFKIQGQVYTCVE